MFKVYSCNNFSSNQMNGQSNLKIQALTQSHIKSEVLILLKSTVDWQQLSSYLSLQLQIQVYWVHMKNLAASDWTKVKGVSYWLTQFFKHDEIHACAPTICAREAFKQFSAANSSSKSNHATLSATYATLMCRISVLKLSQSKYNVCVLWKSFVDWKSLLKLLKSQFADTT